MLNGGRPVAQSIPATEHSVMTAWPTEQAAIENMIEHFGSGVFACVMDSYDYATVSLSVCALLLCHLSLQPCVCVAAFKPIRITAVRLPVQLCVHENSNS